jgi:hypothetical protein
MSFSVATICLVALHGGPADHFATFVECWPKNVGAIEIYASGAALKKFQERGIEVKKSFSVDQISSAEEDMLAEELAKTCTAASAVITDVGHRFDVKIQKALSRHATHVLRIAYYDNFEPYVPGGYSIVAAQVMLAAQHILFANFNLTTTSIFQEPGSEIDFGSRKKVGIGFYPVNQATKIAQRRVTEHLSVRHALFSKNALVENGQKILVYFGGNNEEYFTEAFPAFLKLLEEGMEQSDLGNLVIVIQQHPGAKGENIDRNMVSAWMSKQSEILKAPRIILSDLNSDEAQIVADGVLYHQTSMALQFFLADLPMAQIGHKVFQDTLVRNQLIPSVTNVGQFIDVINSLTHQNKQNAQKIILEDLGIKANWLENLEQAMKI